MHRMFVILLFVVVCAVSCRKGEDATPSPPREEQAEVVTGSGDRSVTRVTFMEPPVVQSTEPIDWKQSAGIFIGIEHFDPGLDRPTPVHYAADDATDLAHFFTMERKEEQRLPPDRAFLLLSGQPQKPQSQQSLQNLERHATVVFAHQNVCIDAAMIYRQLDELAQQVGEDGVLIVSIATHGFTAGNQQILLTCDSHDSKPKGVLLGQMLQSLRNRAGRRLLLFVDACRTPRSGGRFAFHDNELSAGYAVLFASSPRRKATSSTGLMNGIFTRAVVEGLQCRASAGADGFISARELHTYVGTRVLQLSQNRQRSEGHFAGEFGDVELVNCSPAIAATVIEPLGGEHVKWRGPVRFRVHLPDLYATVLVCAASNGVCYNQNPGFVPMKTRRGKTYKFKVHYGAPDTFSIWIVLTADREFLRGETEISPLPDDERAERTVYWLGPVDVTFDRN